MDKMLFVKKNEDVNSKHFGFVATSFLNMDVHLQKIIRNTNHRIYTGQLEYLAGRIFVRVAGTFRYFVRMASHPFAPSHLLWVWKLVLLSAIWCNFH